MSRLQIFRISFLALMLMLLALGAPAVGASSAADNTVWSGEYFNNVDLIGPPALLRGDPNINFFWGEGVSPAPGYVGSSNYSVRWTRSIYFDSTGTWTFTTVNDDGMRVWVDNNITMDAWYDQGPTQHIGTISLNTGWHTVKVEYYNRTNAGTAQVTWARGGSTPSLTWRGEYFNNQTLSGTPTRTRNDSAIDFNWGTGSPFNAIPSDHFSARWRGTVYLDAATYRLTATVDDGIRVWVDGTIRIDQWHNSSSQTYTTDIYLGAGNHNFRVEYYEDRVTALIRFSFSQVGVQPPPPSPNGTWYGQYFNNVSLSGNPVLVRNDAAVNFDWGTGSPGPNVPVDNFSVKWDGNVYLSTSGNYSVTATSDDGVRVWVDGQIALDWWYDHPPMTFTSTRNLSAGSHTVHVEYYERTGGALINVQINPVSAPPPTTGAWYAQYFNNISLSGYPVLVRNEASVNYDWGTGSPGPNVPADYFSAKWDATINYSASGTYNLVATSDDGVRVWVDNAIAIDAWYDHAPTTFTATRYLNAGAHTIHVEYYERTGGALINVQLTLANVPPPTTSDVIVDDTAPGWQAGGCGTCWRASGNGVGNHSFWTYNNTVALEGYDWARWFPYLPRAGNYEVFAYIPGGLGNTTNARYWIKHAGQYNLAARNQGAYYNQWVSLGTYYFYGTADENVSLTDVTGESYLSHTIVYDAIKFSPR